jgi:hypothetical protein
MQWNWMGTGAIGWTFTSADLPDTIEALVIQAGDARRTIDGTLRTHQAYSREGFRFVWTGGGTLIKNYLDSVSRCVGTVLVSDKELGTFTCRYIPQTYSYKPSGYTSWDFAIELQQV